MRKQEAGGEGKVLAVNEVTEMQKGLGSCGDKLEGGVGEGVEKGGIWAGVWGGGWSQRTASSHPAEYLPSIP